MSRKERDRLNEVLSWEAQRVVLGDWPVTCAGKRYPLDRQHEALSLVRRKVIVRTLRNGRVQLVYRGQALKWRELPAGSVRKPPRAQPVRAAQRQTALKPPALTHPWRRDGVGTPVGLRSAPASLRPAPPARETD